MISNYLVIITVQVTALRKLDEFFEELTAIPSKTKNMIESYFNPKIQAFLNASMIDGYQNLTIDSCFKVANCNIIYESGIRFLRKVDIMNTMQNKLPSLGDYIFGLYENKDNMDEFHNYTKEWVYEFFVNQVQNVRMTDLATIGSIGEGYSFLSFNKDYIDIKQSNEFLRFYDAIQKSIGNYSSFIHPCKNVTYAKICNRLTNVIMATNLDKFFKIMLLSSTIHTEVDASVINELITLKSFAKMFKIFNLTKSVQPNWPFVSSCFKKTVFEDDEVSDCKLSSTTLSPIGICSSFNAFPHEQIYTNSEHLQSWTSAIKEKGVRSKSTS